MARRFLLPAALCFLNASVSGDTPSCVPSHIPEIPTPAPTLLQCLTEIVQDSDTVEGLIQQVCGEGSGSCQPGALPQVVYHGISCPSDLVLKSQDPVVVCCEHFKILRSQEKKQGEKAELIEDTDKTRGAAVSSTGSNVSVGATVGAAACVLVIAGAAFYVYHKVSQPVLP